MSKWTISSTGRNKLEAVEITVRKYPQKDADVGDLVAVTLRNPDSSSGTTDSATFEVVAAIWRDKWDERQGRALYVLLRYDATDNDRKAAENIVQKHRNHGAKDAGTTFGAIPPQAAEDTDDAEDAEDAETEEQDSENAETRALVKVGATLPATTEPDVVRGCVVDDGPFELTGGPTAAELRTAILEEIDGAEKAISAARSKMKKLALKIADLRVADLPDGSVLSDYKIAQAEWMHETNALAGAQDRLRSLDADIARGKIK